MSDTFIDSGSLTERIDAILTESAASQNPYFEALRSGAFERADFLETQIQFYFAVIFFSRPMAAVAAKIPDADRRVEILRNVWEEHGEGEERGRHGATFLEFLERLGDVTLDDVRLRPLWPEVRMFNTTLVGACALDDYLVGVCTLGMIERLFSDISAWIGQSVVERGWVRAKDLVHYDLHAQLDVRHADDFFRVAAPEWEVSDTSRYAIDQGLRLGAHAFMTLYEGLHRARERRWICESPLPLERA